MLIGTREGDNRKPAAITLGQANFGFYPMGNGLTRLQTRFLGEPEALKAADSKDRHGRSRQKRPPSWALSRSPTKTSTGTTNCA